MQNLAIRAEGLTKRYRDVAALDHLDLEVAPGEVIGYLGPNGAGKTTTIKLLLGLISASSGPGRDLRRGLPGAGRSRRTAASPSCPGRRTCGRP